MMSILFLFFTPYFRCNIMNEQEFVHLGVGNLVHDSEK